MSPEIGRRTTMKAAMTAAVAVAMVSGCAKTGTSGGRSGDALAVYATTGYLADAVANIAPDADVTTMVGPGGDPHTYQPSTKDIEKMRAADLVLWNGLHLEAQMDDQLASFGDRQLAVGDKVPTNLLHDWQGGGENGGAHDPHIWNSPEAWTIAVDAVAHKIAEVDPANERLYLDNVARYKKAIDKVDAEAEAKLANIPAPRILVTGHDAFGYFGARYNLTVKATDFMSTEAQRSPQEINELASLIADNKVPVIFPDNQANPQAITSLKEAVAAKGWQVEVSREELYADSLGSEPGVDTYLGVFLHNADAVAAGLGGNK